MIYSNIMHGVTNVIQYIAEKLCMICCYRQPQLDRGFTILKVSNKQNLVGIINNVNCETRLMLLLTAQTMSRCNFIPGASSKKVD